MAVVACLGWVNYWVTLPFFGLMVAVLVFGLSWPTKLPDLGKRQWPPWAIRLWFSFCLVLVVGVFIPLARREARGNPNCEAPIASSAPAETTRWFDPTGARID